MILFDQIPNIVVCVTHFILISKNHTGRITNDYKTNQSRENIFVIKICSIGNLITDCRNKQLGTLFKT